MKKSTIGSHKRNCRCCCIPASTDIMICMNVHRSICFSGFSAEKELNKLKLTICLSVRLLKLWKQHTRLSSTGDKCWVCKRHFKDGHHPLLVSPERHQVTAVDEIPSTPGWLLFVCRIIILNTPVCCITNRTVKKRQVGRWCNTFNASSEGRGQSCDFMFWVNFELSDLRKRRQVCNRWANWQTSLLSVTAACSFFLLNELQSNKSSLSHRKVSCSKRIYAGWAV